MYESEQNSKNKNKTKKIVWKAKTAFVAKVWYFFFCCCCFQIDKYAKCAMCSINTIIIHIGLLIIREDETYNCCHPKNWSKNWIRTPWQTTKAFQQQKCIDTLAAEWIDWNTIVRSDVLLFNWYKMRDMQTRFLNPRIVCWFCFDSAFLASTVLFCCCRCHSTYRDIDWFIYLIQFHRLHVRMIPLYVLMLFEPWICVMHEIPIEFVSINERMQACCAYLWLGTHCVAGTWDASAAIFH